MKKVLLIYGGNSSEHEVSCLSKKSIEDNIDSNKYELTCIKISKNNRWLKDDIEITNVLEYLKMFDVIFPIIHGTNGEDGRLQGFLDICGCKYIGSGCLESAICMDKEITKIIAERLQIPVVPYQTLKSNKIKINLKFPLIVKPANGGSSIGITKVNNKKELKQAIKLAKQFDSKILIEKYSKFRELECSCLKNNKLVISQPGEIISANEFYDYNAKYENEKSKTIIPAVLPKSIEKEVKNYCKILFDEFNLKSLARIDFFYDEVNNIVYFNEINTLPGFTKISMYAKLLENMGISYTEVITRLIESI